MVIFSWLPEGGRKGGTVPVRVLAVTVPVVVSEGMAGICKKK